MDIIRLTNRNTFCWNLLFKHFGYVQNRLLKRMDPLGDGIKKKGNKKG